MINLIKKNKMVVLFIVILMVAAIMYTMFSGRDSASPLSSETVGGSQADQVLVDELLQLRSIRLDGAIFADPAFASLRDSGVDIVSEPIGRRNPFAPLDASGGSSQSATPSDTQTDSQSAARAAAESVVTGGGDE